MLRVSGAALMASLAVAAVGCGAKGSCDQRASAAKTCVEPRKGDGLEVDCKSSPVASKRGTWTTTACDRSGAIGACETDTERTWYYPGGRASKVEHVKSMCELGTTLGPDGKKANVVGEKLLDVTLADPGLIALGAPYKAQLDANTTAIAALKPTGAVPGTVKLSSGKHVGKEGTAAVWQREIVGFTDTTLITDPIYPTPDAAMLHRCGVGWKKQDRQGMPDDTFKEVFKWCAGLTTLIMLSPTKIEKPKAKGTTGEFYAGIVTGTAYVFELPSGKLAGGFPFKAESSDIAKSNNLEGDFVTNVGKVLTTSLAKADPGATFTFTVRTM